MERSVIPAPRLPADVGPGVIHEDAPHHLRGDGEEVGASAPPNLLIDQADVCLVNDGGALEGMTCAFAPHIVSCEPAQLAVDHGSESLEGSVISLAPADKEMGELLGRGDSRGWDD